MIAHLDSEAEGEGEYAAGGAQTDVGEGVGESLCRTASTPSPTWGHTMPRSRLVHRLARKAKQLYALAYTLVKIGLASDVQRPAQSILAAFDIRSYWWAVARDSVCLHFGMGVAHRALAMSPATPL
jgi:hypothetical protein